MESPRVEGEYIVIVASLTEIVLTGCLGVELIIGAEGPIEFWEDLAVCLATETDEGELIVDGILVWPGLKLGVTSVGCHLYDKVGMCLILVSVEILSPG